MPDSVAEALISGRLSLAPYRLHKLQLQPSRVAVLATQSTGWSILEKEEFEILRDFFSTSQVNFEDLTYDERRVATQLWEAGLLNSDGRPNPATKRTQEDYPSSLLLKMTGACNIECTYCYDYDSARFKKRLEFNKIAEVIAHLLSKRDGLSILFHGGEPLLNFGAIKAVVDFALKEAGSRERLHFGVQTNGTLFTEENVAFFRDNNFSVGLSLDSNVESGNGLRVTKSPTTVLSKVNSIMQKFPGFLQERAGVLAVVSKTSLPHMADFMLWLQENDISAFSVSFLDLVGRAENLAHEKPSAEDAVSFYSAAVEMIRTGRIQKLNLKSLSSHINNFFTFQPRDFCHKGPCGAAGDFLVLDAEGSTRTCDCIYDPYFMISKNGESDIDSSIRGAHARDRIVDRHAWLRDEGPQCSRCELFGLCGGTCVAKALAVNGDSFSINPVECAISKYIYPLILEEFSSGKTPVLDYYHFHKRGKA